MSYRPQPHPQMPAVSREFQRIADAINQPPRLTVFKEAPINPQEGDMVIADGTNWNPGGGYGPYIYLSSGWAKVTTS